MSFEFERKKRFGDEEVVIVKREINKPIADLAAAFIERWGMVAGRPDGEDSSGRAKLALLTPEEVIDRACKTAELADAEFRKRKWILTIPKTEDLPKPKKDE